jgi:hypothetical protein
VKIVLEEVTLFSKDCLKDMDLQIEVQKMYVNLSHPDFALNKQALDGNSTEERVSPKSLGLNQEHDFEAGSSEFLGSEAFKFRGKDDALSIITPVTILFEIRVDYFLCKNCIILN